MTEPRPSYAPENATPGRPRGLGIAAIIVSVLGFVIGLIVGVVLLSVMNQT